MVERMVERSEEDEGTGGRQEKEREKEEPHIESRYADTATGRLCSFDNNVRSRGCRGSFGYYAAAYMHQRGAMKPLIRLDISFAGRA